MSCAETTKKCVRSLKRMRLKSTSFRYTSLTRAVVCRVMFDSFASKVVPRQAAQLAVNDRSELLQCELISGAPCVEERADLFFLMWMRIEFHFLDHRDGIEVAPS